MRQLVAKYHGSTARWPGRRVLRPPTCRQHVARLIQLTGFIHLHTHSHYSLLEGVAAPEALARREAPFGMPALAITDHGALYGAVPFYQACRAAEVQPLLRLELDTEAGDRLVLLARDPTGYRSLCRLASAVGTARAPGRAAPRASMELLRTEHAGLLALSGGRRALLPRRVGAYEALFGRENFYVELVQHDSDDVATVDELQRLADTLGVPAVVTNDTLAAGPDAVAQAALLDAIRTRTTLIAPHPDKTAHPERCLKSAKQMGQLFPAYP